MIPAHNEEATIESTVQACLAQEYPIDQVIVVADNCTDATADRARRAGATVLEGRGGCKASAQNLALPLITSDVVLALDADATLSAHATAFMVDTIRAGAAGTCPAALPRQSRTIYAQYRTIYHAISNAWIRRIQDMLDRQLVLSGMANCHRTDVLRRLGGFPEDIITEDFNLTWALHRNGYPVAFTPNAIVYTQEPDTLRELLSQLHRWTAGFAQSMTKHRAPLLDPAAFLVVSSQVTDAALGSMAMLSFLSFLRTHRLAALWRWWSPLWLVVSAASIGVAMRELGVRRTVRCLPGWLVLQTLTSPLTAWWLFREWVLGRHLTTWTGRHGRKAELTRPGPRRKAVLACGGAIGAVLVARRLVRFISR